MKKVIFFSGEGTSYRKEKGNGDTGVIEIYPETLPALRFMVRRGFTPVLVTSEYWEIQAFQKIIKDQTLSLDYWHFSEGGLAGFLKEKRIDAKQSYFITDNNSRAMVYFQKCGCKIILVLSGKGFHTLQYMDARQVANLTDVCKDIYAAAISIAIEKTP